MQQSDNYTTRDLARLVHTRLADRGRAPQVATLEELLHVLFLVSLKTEEHSPIRCTVAFASPRRPDPTPPPLIRSARWIYVPFRSRVAFGVASLAKLALASDPDSSALAVFPTRRGRLEISGLFDQQAGYQSMLRYGPIGGFASPGRFQVQILGLGHLVVLADAEVFGELRGGELAPSAQEVFERGAVRTALKPSLNTFVAEVCDGVKSAGAFVPRSAEEQLGNAWLDTLRRLLSAARALDHGGAFLIRMNSSSDHLSVKYGLRYVGLPTALKLEMINELVARSVANLVDRDHSHIPRRVYQDKIAAEYEQEDASNALSGAVAFVAALSRVDGLVLLDRELNVEGFGVELSAPELLVRVVAMQSGTARGGSIDSARFGTRHRSMMRYCGAHPGSVGFIVSADGAVRAVLSTGKAVLFWSNLHLWRVSEPTVGPSLQRGSVVRR
jgi:hypothetical protein